MIQVAVVVMAASLNRTSVGLKRGIRGRENLVWASLNRTSVGLKPLRRQILPAEQVKPQSNQRGIETKLLECSRQVPPLASIEPAWD